MLNTHDSAQVLELSTSAVVLADVPRIAVKSASKTRSSAYARKDRMSKPGGQFNRG